MQMQITLSSRTKICATKSDALHASQACSHLSFPHLQHPIHAAASCRSYMRRQTDVHASIERGQATLTTLCASDPDNRLLGCLAPNLSTHARLWKGSPRLELEELPGPHAASHSFRQTARIKVPVRDYTVLLWDPACRHLAMSWGALGYGSGTVPAGVDILDTHQNSLAEIDLGLQSRHCRCQGFSQSGGLLVRHDTPSGLRWTVFNVAGTALHSIASVHTLLNCSTHTEHLVLAPSAEQAALCLNQAPSSRSFFVWHLAANSPQQVDLPDVAGTMRTIVWSPCSARLLTLSSRHACLWDASGTRTAVIFEEGARPRSLLHKRGLQSDHTSTFLKPHSQDVGL